MLSHSEAPANGAAKRESAAEVDDLVAARVTENCRSLVLPCPEDVAIDHAHGRVYISSCARPRFGYSSQLKETLQRAAWMAMPNPFALPSASLVSGAILTLDLDDPEAQPINQTCHLAELGPFRPVGIDLLPLDEQRARLFATDRPGDGRARVVVFEVDRASGSLSQPLLVEHPLFVCAPNDIAATSADSFFFTNSQGSSSYWQQLVESASPLSSVGSIVHCRLTGDAPLVRCVDSIRDYPNGIAYQAAAKTLYVATTGARKIVVYQVHGASDEPGLERVGEIAVPLAADNLTWDNTGNLLLAGSPDSLALTVYWAKYRETCPSMIVRIADPAGAAVVSPVFADDGQRISAASVGALYEKAGRRQLVVGAPFQDRLLVVDL